MVSPHWRNWRVVPRKSSSAPLEPPYLRGRGGGEEAEELEVRGGLPRRVEQRKLPLVREPRCCVGEVESEVEAIYAARVEAGGEAVGDLRHPHLGAVRGEQCGRRGGGQGVGTQGAELGADGVGGEEGEERGGRGSGGDASLGGDAAKECGLSRRPRGWARRSGGGGRPGGHGGREDDEE